ncbi:MAG: hypothetical protein ACI4E1_00605 [Lachnospira sp.]
MRNDFCDYLVHSLNKCIKEWRDDYIASGVALIFGTNAFELTRRQIAYLKRGNSSVRIIIVMQNQMYEKIKDYLDKSIEVIIWDKPYSKEIIEIMRKENLIDVIDTVLFYAQQINDLGNYNILSIAANIDNNIKVFGMEKDFKLYNISNFKYYYKGIVLYKDINEFVQETEEVI